MTRAYYHANCRASRTKEQEQGQQAGAGEGDLFLLLPAASAPFCSLLLPVIYGGPAWVLAKNQRHAIKSAA